MGKKNNNNQPKVKRTYQDSLFRFLFGNKESAIELYNALEGTDYGMDTEVEFTTLENVLYVEGKLNVSLFPFLRQNFSLFIRGMKFGIKMNFDYQTVSSALQRKTAGIQPSAELR